MISEKIREFIRNNSDEIDKETRFLLEKAADQARISEKNKPKNLKMDEKSAEEISKDFIKENNLEDIKNVDQMVFEMGWLISFRDMESAEDTAIVKKTENKANIIVNFPANDYENEKNLLFFRYQIAKAIGYIVISQKTGKWQRISKGKELQYKDNSEIDKLTDRFAYAILMPEEEFNKIVIDDVYRTGRPSLKNLGEYFHVSPEMALKRAEQIGYAWNNLH